MSRMRILLGFDDEATVREIRALLEPHHDVIGTASDGSALMEAVFRLMPDIVVLDSDIASLTDPEVVERIRNGTPSIKLIFLSRSTDPVDLQRAVTAGAAGYVLASGAHEELLPAVEAVQEGETFVTRSLRAPRTKEGRDESRPGRHECLRHGESQRHRVVVADDDEGVRRELSRILAGDYDLVGLVDNGRQLVEAARKLNPDVVIVDIAMPEMNGFEAVRQIRSEGVESKVVFFTTNGSPAYVRKALSLGAAGYVLKLFGVEELPGALEVVLAGQTFLSPSIGVDAPN